MFLNRDSDRFSKHSRKMVAVPILSILPIAEISTKLTS
jgi:hypothetical protein